MKTFTFSISIDTRTNYCWMHTLVPFDMKCTVLVAEEYLGNYFQMSHNLLYWTPMFFENVNTTKTKDNIKCCNVYKGKRS